LISRVRGMVESVSENRVEVRANEMVYEVLVPSYFENGLRGRRGEEVELFVHCYIEGGPGGGAMTPRLVGFATEADREFYLHLTKVPGLGSRTALKTMIVPPAEMSRAIEKEDRAALSGLPGVGKRTADKIIASLKGRLTRFLAGEDVVTVDKSGWGEVEEEAIEVLVQLAYKRSEAEELVARAMRRSPCLETSEEIVQSVFRQIGSTGR